MKHGLSGSDSFEVLLTIPPAEAEDDFVLYYATNVRRARRAVERLKARTQVEGATIEVQGTASRWAKLTLREGQWVTGENSQ